MLDGITKIIQGNAFEQKKKKQRLKFNRWVSTNQHLNNWPKSFKHFYVA